MMWLDELFEHRKNQESEAISSVRAAIALDNFWHHFMQCDEVADALIGQQPSLTGSGLYNERADS